MTAEQFKAAVSKVPLFQSRPADPQVGRVHKHTFKDGSFRYVTREELAAIYSVPRS